MKTLVAVLILACSPFLSAAEPPNPFHDHPIAAPAARPYTEISSPHVASDGENFFAVWGDFRALNSDVYGARFSAAGEPLDPEGRVVHATYASDDTPVAIWNGSEYVVFSNSEILGGWTTRVAKSGDVTGSGERLPQSAVPTSAAWNGSIYAQPQVTYLGERYRLELVLRDAGLTIVRRVLLAEEVGVGNVHSVRVVSDGRRFLVLWERHVELDRIVNAAIVDEDGSIATPPFQLAHATVPTGSDWATFSPDAAWNGTSYLIVMAAPDGLRAIPITSAGERGEGKLVAAGSGFINPAIAWDGHAHLVLWNVQRNFSLVATRGAIVTATGDPVETFPLLDRATYRPAIASNGDVFFAVAAGETFVLRSTGPERIVRRGGPATHAYLRQAGAAIAAGATNFLTAWIENQKALWIGRLSRGGEPLDGGGILLEEAFVTGVRVYAARGFYVVSWQNSPGEVRIARVTEAGEVIDPDGILLSSSGTMAIVASNGAETRVVWGRRNPQTQSPPIELVTATLPERGTIGEAKLLITPGNAQRGVGLFPNGDRFTLIYERLIPPACPQPRFCPAEFEYNSLVIDAAGQPSPPVVAAPRGLFVDAAADERSIVITYFEGLAQHTRRLGLDGVPAGAVVDLPVTMPTQFPRLTRTATGFVLLLNGASVQAIHLDRDGRPVTPPVTLLQGESANVSDATYAGGQTWLTYTTQWRPLPGAHGGTISRAWVHAMGPRRRPTR